MAIYFDPSFVETSHGRELLRSTVRIEPDGKTFFDPFGVSVILALEQIRVGGSAVVRDSTWQIEVVRTVERTIAERRNSAEWESRLAPAEKYPDDLFSQLDESWQLLAKKLARGNLDLRVPPVLGIVMTRSARRDAIPAVLLDLRNEWADARNKLPPRNRRGIGVAPGPLGAIGGRPARNTPGTGASRRWLRLADRGSGSNHASRSGHGGHWDGGDCCSNCDRFVEMGKW